MIFGIVLFLLAMSKAYEHHQLTKTPSKYITYNGMVILRKSLKFENRNGRKMAQVCSDGKPIKLRPSIQAKLKNRIIRYAPYFAISIIIGILIGHVWATSIIPFIGIGATRTWTNGNGTNIWSDAANWDTKPVAADDVVFDATSTANCSMDEAIPALTSITLAAAYSPGILTVNINQTNQTNTVTILAGATLDTNGYTYAAGYFGIVGTLTMGNSTITISPATAASLGWYHAGGTVNYNTSTVIWAASGLFRNNALTVDFYDIVINTGVTVNSNGYYVQIVHNLTMNGTAKAKGNWAISSPSNPNILTLGVNAVFEGVALSLNTNPSFSFTINIPAITMTTASTITIYGTLTNQTGAMNLGNGALYLNYYSQLTTNGNSVTANIIQLDQGDNRIICGASTFTVATYFYATNARYNYLDMGTSIWDVSGHWYCRVLHPTTSTWNGGTSDLNICGTGAQTVELNYNSQVGVEYWNVTISNGSAATITMGQGVNDIRGLLNISSATCTVSETTGNPTWSIYGGITKANGSTWTRGTGLMTLAGTQTITDNGTPKTNLGAVTTSGAITITQATPLILTTLTIANGATWNTVTRFSFTTYNPGGTWNISSLPVGQTTITTLNINLGGTLNSRDNLVSEPFDLDLPIKMGIGC